MKLSLEEFNSSPSELIAEKLRQCCGASTWVNYMLQARPFASKDALFEYADHVAQHLENSDWLEAFEHHPKIGDLTSLREKFANTSSWAEDEQRGTVSADEDLIADLAKYNKAYFNKFGYIFIICATGKSAHEMLEALRYRYHNAPKEELAIAAIEQAKITQIRLHKLLE